MNGTNYWRHRIFRRPDPLEPPIQVAIYISRTTSEALEQDIASSNGRLRNLLERFFGINPSEYAQHHPVRAQALLGGMISQMHWMLNFGPWLPVDPPPAQHIQPPEDLGEPTFQENGVAVWLTESSPTNEPSP